MRLSYGRLVESLGAFSRTSPFKNASWLYLLQLSNYVIPLISVPYLVRVLGPSSYGEVGFCQGLASYLAIGVNYGFDLSATRDISAARSDPSQVSRISSAVWIAKVLLLVLSFTMLLVLAVTVVKVREQLALMVVLFGIVIGNALFPVWLFQGLERMGFISVSSLVTRLLATVAIFIFIKSSTDSLRYGMILSLQWLLMGVIGVFLAGWRLNVYPGTAPWKQVKKVVKDGAAVFSSRALGGVYSAGNPFLLGLLASPATVGYYVAAEKLVRVAVGSFDPLTQALYPSLSRHAAGSSEFFDVTSKRVSRAMISWGVALTLTFLLGGRLIVEILYGLKFENSVIVMEVLGSECLFIAVSYSFGVLRMLPMRRDKDFSIIIAIAVVSDITLAMLLVPKLGAAGMAISVAVSEGIVAASTYLYSRLRLI